MRLILLPTLLVLGACASTTPATRSPPPSAPAPATAATLQPGVPARLAPGDAAILPDRSTLRYLGIASDSRCPPGAQCIRAGEAEALFQVDAPSGRDARSLVISTRSPTASLGDGHLLVLDALGVGPEGAADVHVEAGR